ncbi:unnamed protein product, partial [Urochloa humidicola]
ASLLLLRRASSDNAAAGRRWHQLNIRYGVNSIVDHRLHKREWTFDKTRHQYSPGNNCNLESFWKYQRSYPEKVEL